jgi:DNA-binding NarL/FixJ family response regulator
MTQESSRPGSGVIRPTKVLIVSESAIVRAGIKTVLDDLPDIRIVGEASSLDRLPRRASARSADILLLSPLKSVADSLELLRHARAARGDASVMLIVQEEHPLEVSRALLLGCLGYVNLSLSRDAFVQSVRRIARGERVVEPVLLDRVLQNLARQPAEPEGLLSAPERAVLQLLSEGQTNREIARRLGYSLSTVKDYVQRILQKLEAPNRTQAAVKAVQLGL